MLSNPSIEEQADSVMEILAAQCADLEGLLSLARRETIAAEQCNFDEIMRVVEERASLGERLETYHRQIAEIRARLGETIEPAIQSTMAKRAVQLAIAIQTQDAQTLPLLAAAKQEASDGLQRMDQKRRGVRAYLRDARHGSIACDQII